MEEKRVKLRVLGITTNQIQTGAYALILSEEGGNYRLPIVIGASEAQSIAAKLENVTLPRPLVHDVLQSMTHAFGIVAKEVYIYKFNHGVFYSELKFSDGEREVKIDCRTSDAIAIALRSNAPIFISEPVLKETGFWFDGKDEKEESVGDKGKDSPDAALRTVPLSRFAVPELEKMLQSSIAKEEYERAAEIKKIIEQKKTENQHID